MTMIHPDPPIPFTPMEASIPFKKPLFWGAFSTHSDILPLCHDHNDIPHEQLLQILNQFKALLGYEPSLFTSDANKLKKLTLRQTKAYLSSFIEQAQTADLLHLYHDYSVFTGSYLPHQGIECFAWLLSQLANTRTEAHPTIPIFTTFNQAPSFFNAPLRLLEQWAWSQKVVPLFQANTVHWAVCHHTTTKQQLIQSGFCAEKICLLPHFVPTPSHLQQPIMPQLTQEVKQRLQYKATDVVLGMLGFMSPAKRYEDAINALKFLPNHYKLLIIGGSSQRHPKQNIARNTAKPSYEQRLVQLVYEMGLQNRVLITGLFLDDYLPSYIDCVDLFIAPYAHQFTGSYGTINLLITTNKPLITSNCPAFVEMQHQAQCFAMFEAEDPQDLAQTIQHVQASPKQRAFLLNALKTYTQEHCALTITQRLLDTYKQIQQPLSDNIYPLIKDT
jgi:glycosyltransferase involved in cell wall biosynthesis